MRPRFDFGLFTMPAYEFFAILGAVLAFALVLTLNAKHKAFRMPLVDVVLFFLYVLLGVFIGGRLLFAITQIPLMIEDPSVIASVFLLGGQVFYGGLIGGIVAGFLYVKAYGLDPVVYIRLATIAIPLGHGCGRLGCFFTGCCHGKPTDSIFGVRFPDSALHPGGSEPLHPTQLYETGFNALLFAVLLLILFRYRGKNRWLIPGTYLLAYPLFRFSVEFLRGDDLRGMALLSTSQWISIPLFILGVWMVSGKFKAPRFLQKTPPWSKKHRERLKKNASA